MNKTEQYYQAQVILACKKYSGHDYVELLECLKRIWMERCDLEMTYFWHYTDAFQMLSELVERYIPMNQYMFTKFIVNASPENCFSTGYRVKECHWLPDSKTLPSYDYWTAMFCSIVSIIKLTEVRHFPFELGKLEF